MALGQDGLVANALSTWTGSRSSASTPIRAASMASCSLPAHGPSADLQDVLPIAEHEVHRHGRGHAVRRPAAAGGERSLHRPRTHTSARYENRGRWQVRSAVSAGIHGIGSYARTAERHRVDRTMGGHDALDSRRSIQSRRPIARWRTALRLATDRDLVARGGVRLGDEEIVHRPQPLAVGQRGLGMARTSCSADREARP